MADIGFVWDEDKYDLVQTGHGVTFAEVVEALSDPRAMETFDPPPRPVHGRWRK